MIVIRGRVGKSKILENLIRKEFMTNSVLILDVAEGNRVWADGEWATKWKLEGYSSYEEVIKAFKDSHDAWKDFDWVAFYINSDVDSIESFKVLDSLYPQNFIVTIQDDNGITAKYFL